MQTMGKAKNQVKMMDRPRQIIDWTLLGAPETQVVRRMVKQARLDQDESSQKLIWFWEAAKNAEWDEDEAAWWILSGAYHELTMGQDLTEVF